MTALLLAVLGQTSRPVRLNDLGDKAELNNGIVRFQVDKSTGTIQDMHFAESPNLAGRGAYFAIANKPGNDGWDIHNADFKVVKNTPDIVDVSVKATVGGCEYDQHYVLLRDGSGFYVYVRMSRPKGLPPETFGQVRWSCYLKPEMFDYAISNDQEQGLIPDLTGAEKVQDATYRTADGKVYTKYDFCDYYENHFAHGITASKPGGYGAFVVTGSNEYLGGPNRQEIMVHSGPIIHRFLNSGHFMPRNLAHPALPDDWSKLCGPWFVVFTHGGTTAEMWDRAKMYAKLQRSQWPYRWLEAPDYPLERPTVKGQLRANGRPAANALIVLSPTGSDWQAQILGYLFNTRSDRRGAFSLPKVRPGTYDLVASIPGYTEEFREEGLRVDGSGTVDLGDLAFRPEPVKREIWKIGFPDRTTKGFRLSDQPRQYGLDAQVPADLTYVVGKSDPAKDWWYAQTKPGDWNIEFPVSRAMSGMAELTIGVAGQTNDPRLHVRLNGEEVGVVTTAGNSSALYRSAVLGSSYYEVKKVTFPAEKLRRGANTITLRMEKGSIMYDTVRLAIP